MSTFSDPPGDFQATMVRERLRKLGVTIPQIQAATGKCKSAVCKWFTPDPSERTGPRAGDVAIIAIAARWTTDACLGLRPPRTVRYDHLEGQPIFSVAGRPEKCTVSA